MIINVHTRQKIHVFMNHAEFQFIHKLLFGVSLGGAITHMLPGEKEVEMFDEMFKRWQQANNNLNEKQINL